MAQTEAQKRARNKWQTEKVEEVRFRVPKGEKARIQEYADRHGETLNGCLRRVIREAMEKDKGESANAFICRAINETIERDNEL